MTHLVMTTFCTVVVSLFMYYYGIVYALQHCSFWALNTSDVHGHSSFSMTFVTIHCSMGWSLIKLHIFIFMHSFHCGVSI